MFTFFGASPGVVARQEALELRVRRPRRAVTGTPVLFVHGAFAGAWCWDRHFLPYLAARGFVAAALSLRGHGASPGRERLSAFGIDDYTDDVEEAVEQLGSPPVVVGHSMGGLVAQRLLERRRLPGAVLVSPVPPNGLLASTWHLAATDPWLLWQLTLLQTVGPDAVGVGAAERALFHQSLPRHELRAVAERMQRESPRAIAEMCSTGIPRPWGFGRTPVDVIGAAEDALIRPWMVRFTAVCHGTSAELLPGLGHAVMLEPGWRAGARAVVSRLERRLGVVALPEDV